MGIKKVGSNRPVVAVNPNGTVAGFFGSIKLAASISKVDRNSITDSCLRGAICRDLRFYYEKDFRKIYEEQRLDDLKFTRNPNIDINTGRFVKGNKASKGFNNWSKERQKKQRKLSREKCLRLINDPDSNFGPNIKSSKPLGKKVICLETKEVFLSAAECARKMNLNVDGLYSSIRRMNKYNGKKYMYLSVYEEINKKVNDNMSKIAYSL